MKKFKLNNITKAILLAQSILFLASCSDSRQVEEPTANQNLYKISYYETFPNSLFSHLSKKDFIAKIEKGIRDFATFYAPIQKGDFKFSKDSQENYFEKSATIPNFLDDRYVSDIQREPILSYNTGSLDTSNKWIKKDLVKLFSYHDLNRQQIIDDLSLDSSNGLIFNEELNDKLADLTTNEDGKVLVLDNGFKRSGNHNYDRLKKVVFINKNGENNDVNKEHLDIVLYHLIGKKIDVNQAEEDLGSGFKNKHINYLYPGFLRHKGTVSAILANESSFGNFDSFHFYEKNRIDDFVSNGYKIINASFSSLISDTKEKHLPDLLERNDVIDSKFKKVNDNFFESVDVNQNDLLKLNKKDVLLVKALGNAFDKEVPLMSLALLATKYEGLKDMVLLVGAYDPETNSKTDYSNACHYGKDFCLYAPARSVFEFSEDYKNKTGKRDRFDSSFIGGTSVAAPYVSGTAAMVKSVFPFMSNRNLQQTLLTTSKDLGEKGVDGIYGWGLLQPQKAVLGPSKFQGKEFNVNLGNTRKGIDNKVFVFSNDINGDKGLNISGDDRNIFLNLTGHNTYKGKTYISFNGKLNVDGIVEGDIQNTTGILSGSGYVGNVSNYGKLINYSINRKENPHHISSQYGLTIKGNYEQGANGVLSTFLGEPLLVEGYAKLDGNLNIVGIKNAYISKEGKLFEDVLFSQKGIDGKFNKISLPDYLENPELKYNKLISGNKGNTVSLFVDFIGYDKKAAKSHSSGYVINKKGLDIIKKLDNKVAKNETKHSKKGVLSHSSSIVEMLGNVQSASSKQYSDYLDTLSFSETNLIYNIEDSVKSKSNMALNSKMMLRNEYGWNAQYDLNGFYSDNYKASLHSFNLHNSTGEYSYGLSYHQIKAKSKNINNLNLNLSNKGGYIYSNWYNDGSFKLSSALGFDKFNYKINKTNSHIGLKNINTNYTKNEFYQSHTLSYSKDLWSNLNINPFIGYKMTYSKSKDFSEDYGNFIVDFKNKNKLSHNLSLGMMIDYNNAFSFLGNHFDDIKLKLGYQATKNLNKNIFDIKIKDNLINVNSKTEHKHNIHQSYSIGIEKTHLDYTAGINITKTDDDINYGLEIKYHF